MAHCFAQRSPIQVKYSLGQHISYDRLGNQYKSFVGTLTSIIIPINVDEAQRSKERKKAMDEEMKALQRNETWVLVPLPQGKKVIGCRWVYTLKLNAVGTLERFKARLVAKGYTQSYGIDYFETFAPMTKLNTVKILIVLAPKYGWDILQFDVKNAFSM